MTNAACKGVLVRVLITAMSTSGKPFASAEQVSGGPAVAGRSAVLLMRLAERRRRAGCAFVWLAVLRPIVANEMRNKCAWR